MLCLLQFNEHAESHSRASEAENCLAEAIPAAVESRGDIRIIGEGPIELIIKHPVFCLATDALAGMMAVEIRRFADTDATRAFLDNEYQDESNQENEYVCPALHPKATAPVEERPFDPDDHSF